MLLGRFRDPRHDGERILMADKRHLAGRSGNGALEAGLDTFAYRQPTWAYDLAIVEIDHPASQQFKLATLARAGVTVPCNVYSWLSTSAVDAVADKLVSGASGAIGFGSLNLRVMAWRHPIPWAR